MKRKLTLLTNFVQSVLVAMFFLFSIGEIRAQLPYSQAHFGTGNTATINGVKVTRLFQGNVVGVAPANRLSAANGYCAGFPTGAQYAIVNTAGNGQIVYVFNEPVKEVDVDLIGMGRKNDSSKEGRVTLGIFCGSGTTASLKILPVGYIGCNQGTYYKDDTGAYVGGKGQSNYRVRIKSADDEPFSILVVRRPVYHHNEPVMVEINKIVKDNRFSIDISTQPQGKTTCAGGGQIVLKSVAALTTTYAKKVLKYQWQKSTNNGASWTNIDTEKIATSGQEVKLTIGSPLPSHTGLYRVAYRYAYGIGNCVMEKVTDEVNVTVNGGIVTELSANPKIITGPTNVAFTIKGTPNADVTYNVAGVNKTTNLGASGQVVVNETLSDPAVFTIRSVKLNGCTIGSNKKVEITQGCGAMPAPVFDIAMTAKAELNGITVTRTLTPDSRTLSPARTIQNSDISLSYISTGAKENAPDHKVCGTDTYAKGYVQMDSDKIRKVTYEFDKPIKSVEIYLQKFGVGYTGNTLKDKAIFTVNNGTIALEKITSCNASAQVNINGNTVTSGGDGHATHVSIKVTSSKPFTKLDVATDDSNLGYGYYMEICPTSLVSLDNGSCRGVPASVFTTTVAEAGATVEGINVIRKLEGTLSFSNNNSDSYCLGSTTTYPNKLPYMNSNAINKTTYKFSRPVSAAEIYFVAFGQDNGSNVDMVTLTANKGTTSVEPVYACDPTAFIVTDNQMQSLENLITDVGVRVTSTEPFTELVIADNNSTAGGYFVVLCANSVQVVPTNNGASCTAFPVDPFGGDETSTPVATNGVNVTRKLTGSGKYQIKNNPNYCLKTHDYGQLPWLRNDRVKQIDYTFDKPVTSAEIWLTALGDAAPGSGGVDKVRFALDCGAVSLTMVSDCKGTTTFNSAKDGVEDGTEIKGNDVGIKIASKDGKPFSRISVIDNGSTAGGVLVSFCKTSPVVPTLSTSIDHPQNTTVCVGKAAKFEAKATLTGANTTVTYQWQESQNGVTFGNLNGESGSVANGTKVYLTITPTTKSLYNNRQYRVVFKMLCGAIVQTSTAAKLTVNSALTINTQPVANTPNYCKGAAATALQVAATGDGTLSYQWYKNTVSSTTGGTAVGSNQNSYTPITTATGTTYYYVVVRNSCGVVTSSVAPINVVDVDDYAGINISISPATYPDKEICTGATAPTIQAKASLVPGAAGGYVKYYQLQYATAATGPWTDHPTQKYTNPGGAEKSFTLSNTTVAATLYYRVKYETNAAVCGTATGAKYSNVFKYTVKESAKVTAVKATPNSFKSGTTTNVVFRIEGTPNATVTCQIDSAAPQVITIPNTGTYIFPARSTNTTTVLKVTKAAKDGCETTYDLEARAVAVDASCSSIPAVQFPQAPVAQATLNGVRVTRTTPHLSPAYPAFCAPSYPAGYSLITGGNEEVTYDFDTPVKSVEVWLMTLSNYTGADKVQITTNNSCANVNYSIVYDCKAPTYPTTISSDGTLESVAAQIADVAVKITSDKPFTQLKIRDLQGNLGGGEFVELCPNSIEKVDVLSITTQPTDFVGCHGGTAYFASKAKLAPGYTGTIKYQWQQSSDGGATWVNVPENSIDYQGRRGSATNEVSTELSVMRFINKATSPKLKYRAAYVYELCTGVDVVVATTPAELTVNDPVTLTELRATPATIIQGVNTNVTISIKGTPGAYVVYNIGGGAAQTVTLSAAGEYSFVKTISQTTNIMITEMGKSCARRVYQQLLIAEMNSGDDCTSFPNAQFPASGKVNFGDIEVTRVFNGTPTILPHLDDITSCQPYYTAGLPWLGNNGVTLTYRFSKPITAIDVWLGVVNYAPINPDRAKFTTNSCGVTTLTPSDCRGAVGMQGSDIVLSTDSYYSNDIKVRVTSTKPFTEITIDGLNSGGSGYYVELCPSSVKPLVLSVTTQPISQSTCAGSVATFTAKAVLENTTGNVKYQWQETTNGSSWSNIAGAAGTLPADGTTNYVLTTGTSSKGYRVVFNYDNTGCPAVSLTATSSVATLTIDNVNLTSLSATPSQLEADTATTVVFSFRGTPNAEVTYQYGSELPDSIILDATGVATLTKAGVTAPTTLAVTKIERGSCALTLTDPYMVELNVAGSACTTFPALQFPATAGVRTTTAQIAGMTVTRVIETGAVDYFNAFTYTSGTMCQRTIMAGYPILNKNTSKGERLSYHFEKPVTSVQVWLSGFGGTTDLADFAIDCTGTISVTAEGCQNTPLSVTGARVSSGAAYTQAKVTIRSNKPFKTLTITDPGSTGGGYVVELCPASIQEATVTITQEPRSIVACVGSNDAKFDLKAALPGATPNANVSYRLEQSDDGSTGWAIANATAQIPTGSSVNGGLYTFTLKTVTPAFNGKHYRVIAYYQSGCAYVVATSTVVSVTVPTLAVEEVRAIPTTIEKGVATTVAFVVKATPRARVAYSYNGGAVQTVTMNTTGVYTHTVTVSDTATLTVVRAVLGNCSTVTTLSATVQAFVVPVIEPDHYTVPMTPTGTTTRTIGRITNNDRIGTASVTLSTGGNATLTVTPVPANTPFIDRTTGDVKVPPTTPAGVYTISYQLCTTATPVGCSNGQLTVTITQPTPQINPDGFVVTGTGTRTTPSVFNNDRVVNADGSTTTGTGSTLTITNVTVQPIVAGHPTPTVNADGTITVPNNAVPGVYTITYDVCTTATPSTCVSSTVTLTVQQPAPQINPDGFVVTGTGTRTTPSVFNNDRVVNADGSTTTGTGSTLTITNVTVQPIVAGHPTPTINADGTITVPNNAVPGVYTITYDVCTTATPSTCVSSTVTLTVQQPAPQINPDGFVVTGTGTRTTPSVFNNDRVVNADGSTTTGTGSTLTITNVTVQPIVAGHPTPTINADGTITVPNNAVPGVYTITYDVCTTATPSTCVSSTATLTVKQPAPQINPDGFVVTGTGTRTTPSVFNNDRVVNADGSTTTGTGSTLTITNVTVQPIVAGHPTPTINADGTITVPNNAVPGLYTITYDVCTVATPTECTSGTVTFTVVPQQPTLVVNPDPLVVTGTGTRTTPSVLDNDHFVMPNGTTTSVTTSSVTINNVVVTPSAPGTLSPTLNPDGTITVPNGLRPGLYTITYDACVVSGTCVSATATLTVKQPAPVIRPDSFTVTGTGTRTTPSILDNDDVVNPDGSTTSATGSNVTITNVVVTPTRPGYPVPTVNPNGTITIPENAAPGLYTITYDVCTVATPTECTSGTVTFTVVPQQPTLVVNPDPLVVTGTGTRTTPSVLDNDHFVMPNGTTTSVTTSSVTINNVVVTPSAPGTLSPTLNPDGTITVPNGLRPGLYTITYDACVVSGTCVSATATLTVKQPAPVIRPDSFTVTGTGTRTTPSILDNDDVVNPDGSTTSATGSNVTITNVVVTPTRPGYPVPTVNPNGTITIPENAAPGLYTITYDVCTVATPTECTSGTVTFTVVPQQPTLVVNPDPLVVTGTGTRTTPSVLDNDHFVMPNGTTTSVTTSSVTINNVVVTPSAPGTLSPTLNPDGTITVPNGLRPGLYTITYDACVVSGTCVSATATLTVKQPAPVIRPDSFTVTGTGTRTTPSILDNDDVVNPDGSTTSATGSNVTITNVVVTPTRPGYPVPTVNPNGTITIPNNAAPGLYTITYDVCTVATPTECTSGTVTFTVVPQQPTLVVNPDPLVVTGTGTRTTPSVLDNDHFVMPNGTTTSVTTSSVTINNVVVTPSAPGTLSPTLNPDGTITVPNGLRPGLYTITYDACVVSGTCVSATATLTVKQPAPVIRPDSFTVTGTGTRTTPSILDNDDVVNPDGSTTSATGSNVTITNVVVTPTRPGYPVPTVNPNGTITIPENAAPGLYTITYDVCTVATPTECTSGTVTFTVVPQQPTLVVNPDPLVVTGTGTRTTPSVLDNDHFVMPNGTTTSVTTSSVTINNVVVTPSAPGTLSPTLNPDGTITVPNGLRPGLYTITYDACVVSGTCVSATATLTVKQPAPVIRPDSFTVTGTGTRTTPSILDNDDVVNPDGSTTSATGSNVTITNVVVTPTRPGYPVPTVNPNGTITIPNNAAPGNYTITYNVCTVATPTECTSGTVTFTVVPQQPTLVVNPDPLVVTGTGTRTTPSVLDNDHFVMPNGTTTSVTTSSVTINNIVVTPSAPGTLSPTLNPDGTITVPNGLRPGLYTITYDACVVSGTCVSATATLTVKQPAPVIRPDSFTVTGTGTRTTPSILDNDDVVNPDGSTTSATGSNVTITNVVVTPTRPGYPVPTVNPNGTITIPDNAAPGNYTITYDVCTVATPTECTSGTVTFTIVPQQPTLVVNPDPLVVTGTGTRTTPSVLDNDHFVMPNGTTTSVTTSSVTINNVVVTPSAPGTLSPTLNPDGTITVPNGLRPGLYTITYDMCVASSTCVSATATLTVKQPAPVIRPDSFTVTGTGTRTTPSILDNDDVVNPDGSTTSATGSNVTITNVVVTPTRPGYPVPTVNPNGTITIPDNAAPGNYTITYNVCTVATPTDCTSGTVTFTIVPQQPTLVVNPDPLVVTGTGTRTTPSVLDNDHFVMPNGTTTSVTTSSVTINNVVVTPSAPGTLSPTLNPDGTITVPNGLRPGLYTITYDMCVASSTCVSATATLTVKQPAPVIRPDSFTVTGTGTRTTPSILDNDDVVNPDGSTTSATGSNVTITNVVVTPTRPGYPVPTVNPNGTITIPDNAAPGNYTITYNVCTVATPTDCTSGTVTFTVVPQQPTLVVNPDPLVVTGTGTRTTPSVLDNDHFVMPNGTTTSVTTSSVTINNVVVTPSAPGTLSPTLNPDGTITVPNGLRPGLYTITYDACVVSGTCVSATATLTVKQPAPVIRPDSFTVTGTGTRTTPSILDNDDVVNPDGSTASATGSNVTITNVVVTPTRPGYPVPTVNPNGTITIPDNAAPGNYTITYNVCTVATPTDCTIGVVTFTVVSDTSALPIAENDSAQTFIGTPVTIEVLTNDTPNGAVTPVITITPAKGTAVVNADGTIEYTPNRNFVGTDSFVYELCNAAGCATATVSVKVGSEIIIYNGVSLNGSDANNHFHIGGIENYPNNKVRIYNRWGVEVFSVEGYDNVTKVFTGRSSARTTVEAGDRLPQGTYYYVIEYQDLSDKKQTASGWLYLKK